MKNTYFPSIYHKWCNDIKFKDIYNNDLKVPKQMFTDWVRDFINDAKRSAEAIEEEILTPEQVITAINYYKYQECKIAHFKIIHNILKIKKNSLAQLFKKEIKRHNYLIKKQMLKTK
tara:strand:- start:955 stop:1305 length:351 start_codon:yes stop_codon:yes gene_type:complete